MSSTRDDDPRAIIPNRARGYIFENGELKNSRWSDMSSKMAAGGWVSTAPDLVRFMNAWMEGRLVSQPTMKQMLEPYKLRKGTIDNFGLGLFIDDYHGMKSGLYGGGTAQVSALIFFVPEKRLAVAGMFNLEGIPGPRADRTWAKQSPTPSSAKPRRIQIISAPRSKPGETESLETERVPHPSAHFALEPALSAAEGVGFHERLDRRVQASCRTDADVSLPRGLRHRTIQSTFKPDSTCLPSPIVNISDFRPLAQRRLPKAVFDYLDGGADAEITLRGKLPRLRRHRVSPSLRGRLLRLRTENVSARTRTLISRDARADRLQPSDASGRGSRRCQRRRQSGHCIHSLYHLCAPTGEGQSRHCRPRVLPALLARRQVRS